MTALQFWIWLSIVWGAALVAIVKTIMKAVVQCKKYDLEIEQSRKEGKHENQNDSEGR